MKKTLVKKSFAWLLALVMIIGFMPAYAFAADGDQDSIGENVKFQVKVSSKTSDNNIGAVTATVDKGYKAVVTYNTSDRVNPGNVTADVWMQNVASLGVTDPRHYTRTVNTGIEHADVTLQSVDALFSALSGKQTKVTANINNLSTTYDVAYSKSGDNVTITGTPDSSVADVWHAIVDDNIDSGTNAKDDSYIKIANGSTLQIKNEILKFEDSYTKDLVIDNITKDNMEALVNEIKAAVKVDDAASVDTDIVIFLKEGTTLAMGSSFATLNKDVKITVDGFKDLPDNILSDIRTAVNKENSASELIVQGLGLMSTVINSAAGQKITVNFDFAKPDDYKFRLKVSSMNDGCEGAVTATVMDDYFASIVITGDKVNTSNVKGEVWMQNVASLGVTSPRYYGRALTLSESGQAVNLTAVSNLLTQLDNTKIIGKVGGDEVTYTFKQTIDNNYFGFEPNSEDAARTVWHAIVNKDNIEAGTNEDDSYIVIGNGSSLQVGKYVLEFEENYNDDLKLDDFSNLEAMDTAIREAVALNDVESEDIDNSTITITLAPGTELDVGSSYAKLKQCTTIKITGAAVNETNLKKLETALENLRDKKIGDENTDTMHALWGLLGEMVGMVSGQTTTVEFIFGHDFGEWEETKGATCTEAGEETRTCSICGETETRPVEALGHNYQAVVTAPTCTERGYTTHTCSRCDDSFVDTYVDALGHEWGEPTYEWSTDNSQVTASRTCKYDVAHVDSKTVNTTSEVTKEATETENGNRHYTATFEEPFTTQTKDVVIPATGGSIPGGGGGGGVIDEPDVPLDAPEHDPYMKGKDEGIFDPMGNFTRAEAATVLSRLTNGFKEDGNYTGADFSDVKSGDWFYSYVSFAQDKKLVNGYEDGTFKPNNPITRQEFAVLLARFLNIEPTEPNNEFTDMDKAGDWAKGYVAAMKTNGIIEGYEDGSFRPTNNITRAEAATMLNRVLDRVPLEELELEKKGYENPFTDVNVSEWFFVQVMEATIEHKISDFHE